MMSGEHKNPGEALSEDRRNMPDRVWVGRDAIGGLMIYWKCPEPGQAVEYMRVLSREEVEKLASGEGVDTQQYINSLLRTIEGQRRHIARLEAEKKAHRCHHALDEALNSGDGSYRP